MKKHIAIIFFLLLGSMNVLHAQSPFTLGPKVGFSSSHLSTNQDTLETDFQQGFQGGIFFRFTAGVFYLQPEVMYVTKGGIFENVSNTFKQDVFLQTIDIPLIFGLQLGADELNLRIHGGPMATFVVEKSIKLSGDAVGSEISKRNLKDSFLGAQAGIGIDFMPFSLDVRYETGWDNIYQQRNGGPDLKWMQHSFNLSLALKLL